MRKEIYKRSPLSTLRLILTPILFTLAVTAMIVFALRQAQQSSKAEGLRILEDSLLRAAVKCYAVEGSYPDSVAYIEEHYGVHVDRSSYAVHYEIFASNLLPDITVVELKK